VSADSISSVPHARRTTVLRRLVVGISTVVIGLGAYPAPASAAPAGVFSAHSLTTASARAHIVREASRHVGARYRRGAAGPSSFDCSGFTRYIYSRFGLSLPHQSGAQSRVVHIIATARKQPGDLIFFRTSSGRIDHVGIYAGGNKVYAASRGAGRVKLQTVYTSRISVGRVG
jgi:cell wall-associated NlpC family hydrolase